MKSKKNSNIKIVELLLKNGANVNIQDETGITAFHLAINIEIVELLLKYGTDVNEKINGESILHSVIKQNNKSIMELLLEYGADVNIKNKKLYCN